MPKRQFLIAAVGGLLIGSAVIQARPFARTDEPDKADRGRASAESRRLMVAAIEFRMPRREEDALEAPSVSPRPGEIGGHATEATSHHTPKDEEPGDYEFAPALLMVDDLQQLYIDTADAYLGWPGVRFTGGGTDALVITVTEMLRVAFASSAEPLSGLDSALMIPGTDLNW